ncbi:MAG: UbiD family decarboxylase [Acidobacteria bacterium]|nr:MAG: UbiD family decarboxylase [Acidobacteriota bacterium]
MALSAITKLPEGAIGAGTDPMMPPAPLQEAEPGLRMDLRAFIDALSCRGELKRISDLVDWKIELGEITRNHRQPLLFENIKDYPGKQVFANGLSNFSSVALALGLQPEKGRKAVLLEARRRVAAPAKPVTVSSGPVLENVMEGPGINLYEFPVPQWSSCDAGRYIGTWHANVTRDPETGCRNLGVYRMQLLGRSQATVSTSSASHLGRHFARAERNGKPLEMAVVIGGPEPVVMAAGSGYPSGSDEYDLAGGLSGGGIPLVRCKTVDLEVPAEAEIVLEGLIRPGVRVHDGPYFDYAGAPTENPSAFLFDVTCVMFRNRPIFRGAAVGHRAAEDQQLFALLADVGLFDFHDSRPRHWIQTGLIQRRFFKLFQSAGRAHPPAFLHRLVKRRGLSN